MKFSSASFAVFSALVSLGTLTSAPAHAEWVRYQNFKVALELPKDWQVVKDLYGMPITVLGPERGGERAVLMVQDSPLRDYHFDHSVISNSQSEYIEGRKEWLAQLGDSKYVSAIPYRKLSDANGIDGFEVGFRYEMAGHQFEERSAQLNCGGRFYLVKTLASEKNTAADKQNLAKLVDQFQCAAVTAKDGKYVQSPLHAVQDLIRENNAQVWPQHTDFKSASVNQKAQTLEALVDFYKTYEAAANDPTEFSSVQKPKNAFALFQAKLLNLIPGAQATDTYDCFFGGWPSHYRKINGKVTCNYPSEENSSYPKSQCSGSQLACNPSLFGKDLCVDIGDSGLRAHATMACDAKFKAEGHTFEALVQEKDFNTDLLEETVTSAKAVCSNNDYVSSNYGLCHTLEERLGQSITAGKHAASADDKGFIDNLDKIKKPELEEALGAISTDWKSFEKECFDSKGAFQASTGDCSARLSAITSDMERIEKTDQNAAAQTASNTSGATSSTNCAGCHTSATNPSADDGVPDAGGACSKDELKKQTEGQCNWSSASWWLHTGGSCAKNLFTSVLNDLWSTVSGIGDLAVSAAKGSYHWFMNAIGAENQTAAKAHQASQTSDSFLKQLMAHPVDTTVALMKQIANAVLTFAQNDLLCQSWSGTPHTSKCLAPANFECLPCTTSFNGVCSLAGYAIGEVLPAILTGGASVLTKDGALAAKLGSAMGKASKEGKLLKFVGEIEAKLPKLGKLKIAKEVGIAEKANLAVSTAEKVSLIKRSWTAIKDFKAAFKSKIFGGFETTLEKLKKLKVVTLAQKAGETKVGSFVKGFVGSTASMAKNTVKGIVTLPGRPYAAAYRFGFRTGERIADKAFLKAAEAEAAVSLVGKAGEAEAVANATAKETETAAAGAKLVDHTIPQTTRIAQRTEKYEQDLKAFEGHTFDSEKAKVKAQALIDRQKQLIQQMREANSAAHAPLTPAEAAVAAEAKPGDQLAMDFGSNAANPGTAPKPGQQLSLDFPEAKGITPQMQADRLKRAREAAANFKEMEKNNQKILKIVQKDSKDFELPVPGSVDRSSRIVRALIYSPFAKHTNQVGNQSEKTANQINRKKNDDDNYNYQVKMRDKLMAGQDLTPEETAKLVQTGIKKEEVVEAAKQSELNVLRAKVQGNLPITADDQKSAEKLGITPEMLQSTGGPSPASAN